MKEINPNQAKKLGDLAVDTAFLVETLEKSTPWFQRLANVDVEAILKKGIAEILNIPEEEVASTEAYFNGDVLHCHFIVEGREYSLQCDNPQANLA